MQHRSNFLFFSELFTYLTDLTDFEIVMGTDMNAVMSNELDRSGDNFSYSQTVSTEQLNQCIASFSLVDAWRLFNPSQKSYTFFSAKHKSYSRIDYIFASSSLTSILLEVDIFPLSLSDHSSDFFEAFNYPATITSPQMVL